MIEFQNVSHSFEEYKVLQAINLRIQERRIAIVGSNGSGKSTFVRLINGLLIPTVGNVLVDGLDTRKDLKVIRKKVGFVFQNPDNQIVMPIVEEDIAFGLKNLKLRKQEINLKVNNILEKYGLEKLRKQPTCSLSGGQKQLLAIAAVLVMAPEYIVFDEPTTLLDLRNKNKIAQIIRELKQTVFFVSHDLDLLYDFERIILFEDGQIIMDGKPDMVLPFYIKRMS